MPKSETIFSQTRPVAHVCVFGSLVTNFSREVLAGVLSYAGKRREEPHWRVTGFNWSSIEDEFDMLSRRPPDAIIAQVFGAQRAELMQSLGKPWVNVGNPDASDVPNVISDNIAIGRLGAEELVRRGIRNFLYVGNYLGYSNDRLAGFQSCLAESGLQAQVLNVDAHFGWMYKAPEMPQVIEQFKNAILSIDKPLGIFAHNDEAAGLAIEVCHQTNLHVPEQVAVLGVDNDELNCQANYPTLSSIQPQAEGIGITAAKLLDGIMKGEDAPNRTTIPPVGVVTRMSTDITAVKDEMVSHAITFIKRKATEGIAVEDVAAYTGLSRRSLQMRFQQALGVTIADEIRRCRIDTAKELLRTTDWPIARVASEAGYSSSARLANTFRRELNETPKAYRERTKRI